MSQVNAAVVASAEAGESLVSPYVFGGVALALLVLLLIITMMINVDR
ncbi:MAG: hypothetical protein WEA35_01790 [Candidatus Nanopelagicales bacterium]|jgi:hypothetical protein